MNTKIIGTSQSSIAHRGYSWNLVDNKGLDGHYWHGCAHTGNSRGPEWFSLELPHASKVTEIQIARRTTPCCFWDQGQNIQIRIGNSKNYNSQEPLCLPQIGELSRGARLKDYICTGNPPPGKFVKIAKIGWLVLCEVRVFSIPGWKMI